MRPGNTSLLKMTECVACSKPLTLYIDPDEETASGSGSQAGSYVDDDVELQCGCHFHWSVAYDWNGKITRLMRGIDIGNVY